MQSIDMTDMVDEAFTANTMAAVKNYLAARIGKRARVRVGPPERSTEANSYYWAYVLGPIVVALREAGYERINAKMLHDHYKCMYLPPEINAVPAGLSIVSYSTRHLSSADFTRYVDSIRTSELVTKLGAYIETPEQYQDRTQNRFESWGI